MPVFNVLIAEDEKPLRDKMTQNVDWAGQGYRVYQAEDGEEALQLLRDKRIDILITDIQMPRLTGIELVKRAREFVPNLLVVIVSGYGDLEYSQMLSTLGVHDYLLKPFRSQRLLETVNKVRAANRTI